MSTISLIYNAIIGGQFYNAGDSIPSDVVPQGMRKYEAKENKPSSSKKEINVRRQYGQPYYVNAENQLTMPARRQVAELEAQNAEQDYIDAVANEPPDEATAEMIAQVQEDYQADVQRQIANAKVVAQRSDELNDAFIQERAAQVEAGEFDEMDVDFKPPPVAEPKSKPPPAKPKWLGLLTAS